MMQPLDGVRIVSMAVNLPGPLAATRLAGLGASVTKIEPPTGDPVVLVSRAWYEQLCAGQVVATLDLKTDDGLRSLHELLAEADVLLTAYRPAALARLGLSWPELTARHARLSQVAIVGHGGALGDRAGHDLTYQAESGLLSGVAMPRAPYADLAGAERAVTEVLAAVIAQLQQGRVSYREVSLADVVVELAAPWRMGVTGPDGVLGGGLPTYGIYATADGHIALAAIEPHFHARLAESVGADLSRATLEARFIAHSSEHWRAWAESVDIPLAVLA